MRRFLNSLCHHKDTSFCFQERQQLNMRASGTGDDPPAPQSACSPRRLLLKGATNHFGDHCVPITAVLMWRSPPRACALRQEYEEWNGHEKRRADFERDLRREVRQGQEKTLQTFVDKRHERVFSRGAPVGSKSEARGGDGHH